MEAQKIRNLKLSLIVARPRTGSTLLSVMLNMHPKISIAVEEPFFYNLYFKYKNVTHWSSKKIGEYCDDFYLFSTWRLEPQFVSRKEFQDTLERNKEQLDFYKVVNLTYLCFTPLKDKTHVTDIVDKQLKLYDHFYRVPKMYPNSKFVFLYRDPLDNIARRKIMFKKTGKKRGLLYDAMCWNYDYKKLLKEKNKIDPSRILELKYEDLILNPEKELQQVCSFLGLEYNQSMLNYHDAEVNGHKGHQHTEISQVFSSINEGIAKKPMPDKIGEWRKNLSKADAEVVWSVCGDVAVKMDYEKDDSIEPKRKPARYYVLYLKLLLSKSLIPRVWNALPFTVKKTLKKAKKRITGAGVPQIKNHN